MTVMYYEESEDQTKTRINNFVYHAPLPHQPEKYESIRGQANNLSHHLNACCPPSRELSLAQTKLEEAIFWANAAIARNEPNAMLDELEAKKKRHEDQESPNDTPEESP